MKCSIVILVSLFASVTVAQNTASYGNSYPGYTDDKKQPGYGQPSHTYNKQSGSYPGAYPTGHQPQYRPPGYGGHNTGYGQSQYGYTHQWKHYDYCKPDFDIFTPANQNRLRYLESASEDDLNANATTFQAPEAIRGPNNPPCERGPKYILYSEPYEWHWPPVYKGVCDNLPGCKDPKCISKKTTKITSCVLVFRRYGYRWVRVGYRKITYKSDQACKCRQCKDIKSYRECVHEHPCPNEKPNNEYSYCYWKKPYTPYTPTPHNPHTPTPHNPHTPTEPHENRDKRDTDDSESDSEDAVSRFTRATNDYNSYDHYGDDKKGYSTDPYDPYKHPLYPVPAGSCDCCEPTPCPPPKRFDYDICKCVCPKKKCLPGHKFNPITCKCECPKGTIFDKQKQKCIGKCKELTTKACENVLCKDNPHFYCKLDKKYNCKCPTCDDVDYWQRGLCEKTNCIEQGYKPYCVFDWRNGKCRCPECEDQKTPDQCEKTSCVDQYNKKKCKWVWYPYPTCQCPSYGPPGYGHNNKNPGYGPPSHNPGYGPPSHNPGYGRPSHNPGYGPPSHNPGYGRPSHNPGYGPPSHDKKTPGYGH